MANRVLNMAFIGNGKSTNRYHAPFVLTRPDEFRITHVYERHPGTSAWKALPGVAYTDDLEALLSNPDVDLVSICTPVPAHYDLALRALKAGKHVLVEKPFTQTVAQTQKLFDLAREKGLYLSAYQNRRFDADYLTMQRVIASGKLGRVYEIVATYDYWRPEVPEAARGFDPYNSFVYGHAVHLLDQAVGYLGSPDAVQADVRQILGSGRMNDYFDFALNYGPDARADLPIAPDGLRYEVKASYFRASLRPSLAAYGTRGCFVKQTKDRQEEHLKVFYLPGEPGFGVDRPEDYATVTYYDETGYHEEKVVSEQGDYARLYDSVYHAIVDGAEPVVKPEQTLAVMRIMADAVAGLA